MTAPPGLELLDQMAITYNRLKYARIICLEQEKPEEAAELEKRGRELSQQLDRLLAEDLRTWGDSAAELTADVMQANRELQAHVAEMEKSMEDAERFAKALACVDHVIEVTSKLLP